MCYSLAPPPDTCGSSPRHLWLLPQTPHGSSPRHPRVLSLSFVTFPGRLPLTCNFPLPGSPDSTFPPLFSPWMLLPFKPLLVHFIFHDSWPKFTPHSEKLSSFIFHFWKIASGGKWLEAVKSLWTKRELNLNWAFDFLNSDSFSQLKEIQLT